MPQGKGRDENGCIEEWMTDGWRVDGWTDGQMIWMDGWIDD